MTFRGYKPGHRDGFPGDTAQFSTVQELGQIPHVAAAIAAPNFHRLSLDLDGEPTLIAEYDHGGHWVVVGYIRPPVVGIRLKRFQFRSLSLSRE